ncbi:MAG: hypothetical protein RQM92_09800 [Candidatus Syntrophopropionicum ammoniitolerans]
MIIRDEKLDALKNIIGCRVSTHYNTGGIVIAVAGPFGGCYTITYKHDRDGKKCWINSIRVGEDGVITYEKASLKISGQPAQDN